MPTKLSILVFIASPLDYARYRHAALYLEFEPHAKENIKTNSQPKDPSTTEGDVKSSVMEVVGSPGYFSFYERLNTSPIATTGLAKSVFVSSIPDSVPVSSLRATISGTPVADQEGDWNSQNWVGDALGRLVAAGYLDAAEKDRGLDDMVDVILEAKDEELG